MRKQRIEVSWPSNYKPEESRTHVRVRVRRKLPLPECEQQGRHQRLEEFLVSARVHTVSFEYGVVQKCLFDSHSKLLTFEQNSFIIQVPICTMTLDDQDHYFRCSIVSRETCSCRETRLQAITALRTFLPLDLVPLVSRYLHCPAAGEITWEAERIE